MTLSVYTLIMEELMSLLTERPMVGTQALSSLPHHPSSDASNKIAKTRHVLAAPAVSEGGSR